MNKCLNSTAVQFKWERKGMTLGFRFNIVLPCLSLYPSYNSRHILKVLPLKIFSAINSYGLCSSDKLSHTRVHIIHPHILTNIKCLHLISFSSPSFSFHSFFMPCVVYSHESVCQCC